MYTLTLSSAPATDFLADETVYDHLRVPTSGSPDVPEDATLIGTYRDAVQAHLDGAGGILGRALVTQTWVVKLPAFPCGEIVSLPLPPLQSVSSITYLDSSGSSQTLSASKYDVVTGGQIGRGYVRLAYGQAWPSTYEHPEAVTVTFVAGYGSSASDVPANIRSAGLLLVEDLYRHRAAQSVDYEIHPNPAVTSLLAPYTVFY